MAVIILDGAIATEADAYTGIPNQLTVDESNHDLRLHDGERPGGFKILNRDNADQRYQRRSEELNGIIGFEPQQRGILVRLGPAEYALRTLEATSDFVVVNSNGYEGNPGIALATTIGSDHIWTGTHSFSDGVVEFLNGIEGDVIGDLTGDVTGNVVGNVTGNLAGNAIGNHQGSFTGDVDVRGNDLLLDDGQINLSKLSGLTAAIISLALPNGFIGLWSGAVADIPSPWFLCNGLNGTPDLRSKFIVGAGDGSGGTYAVGASGGAASRTPTITVEAGGAHTHGVSGTAATNSSGVSLNKTIIRPEYEQNQVDVVGNVTLTDPGHNHSVSGTAASAGSHTHTASSSAIDTRPPYYALAYIMKVGS